MKNEFITAISALAAEKNLPRDVVFEAVEVALASAYKKDNLAQSNVVVKINAEDGTMKVYTQKDVVDEVEDDKIQMTVEEARRFKPDANVGDVLNFEATPANAGRIAAQTAKQVVLQRLREAEREVVYEEYSGKEGDIVAGTVQRMEGRNVIVDLGKTEAVLPPPEQVRTEHYRTGQRVKVLLAEVHKAAKGPQVVVSRTHKDLLRRLFELEVPEIFKGVVEIKSIAREAGYRSKVAVWSRQEGVDPVGACVGMRGIRIQNVVNELNGERIDVVQWDPEPSRFVANALSPAQVVSVDTRDAENTAEVVVPDRQLSLAIGKEGQNARLAAKLTGWRIDIKSQSAYEQELAVRYDDLGRVLLVGHDADDLGRAQRVGDEARRLWVPLDHVDALPVEFIHNVLDADATHADAGADRIHTLLARPDGDLGAVAGLAGDRLDLDDALEDLRDFEFEEPAEEVLVRARDDDLRALGGARDLRQDDLEPLA
jgi:N utilization substance protein A